MQKMHGNRKTTIPKQTSIDCNSLPFRQRTLVQADLGQVSGGNPRIWWEVVKLLIGFEAGYQYGKVRDDLNNASPQNSYAPSSPGFQSTGVDNTYASGGGAQEDASLSFATVGQDNTSVR